MGNLSLKIKAAALMVAVIAAGAVYYFFDPARTVWMPRCVWKTVTHTDCPGCGAQRMIHALVHADFYAAWRANAFGVCMIPGVVFLIWLEFSREKYSALYARVHHPLVIWILAGLVLFWWIFRNVVLF